MKGAPRVDSWRSPRRGLCGKLKFERRRWVFSSSWLPEIGPAGLREHLKSAAGAVFALIFPDECRLCDRPLGGLSRVPVCPDCLATPVPLSAEFYCTDCGTPFLNPFPLDGRGRCALCRTGLRGFDAAYSFGAYEGALRELIHLFKYAGVRTLARPLGEFLSRALPREQRFDALVPMPLHWLRRWRRGFNQAELLAREVSRRCGIPVVNAVRRVQATRTQAGLSNSARRQNVVGAFRLRRGARVEGLRILLVDDVMTTGATAAACALVLKRAGAAHVALLVVARVDRRPVAPPAFRETVAAGADVV